MNENRDQMLKIAAMLKQMDITRKQQDAPKASSDYKFWNSQPVVKLEEVVDQEGAIDSKTVDMISREAYPLPKEFEWVTVDLDTRIQQVYELLSNNYVEDDSETFRFNYSAGFLKWYVYLLNLIGHSNHPDGLMIGFLAFR
jgi:glycylpeptide N-tetradecanoyltransferase